MTEQDFEAFLARNRAQRLQDDLDAQAVIRARKRFQGQRRVKNNGSKNTRKVVR